jgi:hypothetical protein
MSANNGQNDTPMVRFGPRPNQVIPAEWAEGILTDLAHTKPNTFGTLLRKQVLAGLPQAAPRTTRVPAGSDG